MSSRTDERQLLFMSTRWVNTIWPGYGLIKQRIFLEIIKELQKPILAVMGGAKVSKFVYDDYYSMELDLANIVHYNNYFQARQALTEMCSDNVQIYQVQDVYMKQDPFAVAPLLNRWKKKDVQSSKVHIRLTRLMAELLIQCDKRNGYTKFDLATFRDPDPEGIGSTSSKYTLPMYMLLCSWHTKHGLTLTTENIRRRLGIEEKYQGFNPVKKSILNHLAAELKLRGEYAFNFTAPKQGREVKSVTFKIFPNKPAAHNHNWFKIQKALEGLPHFRWLNEEHRAVFNYLLYDKHDLRAAYNKILDVHRQLEVNKAAGQPVTGSERVYAYLATSMFKKFRPPDD